MNLTSRRGTHVAKMREEKRLAKERQAALRQLPESTNVNIPTSIDGKDSEAIILEKADVAAADRPQRKSRAKKKNYISESVGGAESGEEGDSGDKDKSVDEEAEVEVAEVEAAGTESAKTGSTRSKSLRSESAGTAGGDSARKGSSTLDAVMSESNKEASKTHSHESGGLETRGMKRSRVEASLSPLCQTERNVEKEKGKFIDIESVKRVAIWLELRFEFPIDVEEIEKITAEIADVPKMKGFDLFTRDSKKSLVGVGALHRLFDMDHVSSLENEDLPSLKGYLGQMAIEMNGTIIKVIEKFDEKLRKASSDKVAWERTLKRERERNEKSKCKQDLISVEAARTDLSKKFANAQKGAAALNKQWDQFLLDKAKTEQENEALRDQIISFEYDGNVVVDALKVIETAKVDADLANSELAQENAGLQARVKELEQLVEVTRESGLKEYQTSDQFRLDAEAKTFDLLQRFAFVTARNALGDGAPRDKVVTWLSEPMYGELARLGHPLLPSWPNSTARWGTLLGRHHQQRWTMFFTLFLTSRLKCRSRSPT